MCARPTRSAAAVETPGRPTAVGTIADTRIAAPGEEQQVRAAGYGLIAALLRSPADQALLDRISLLGDSQAGGDEVGIAISMLGLAARSCDPDGVNDEFHDLFIGLGRGELVPYASWYLTGFLMEKPLGVLRDDLSRLGITRRSEVHEPEDHIAALCEVMAMLIGEGREVEVQQQFFENHLAPWVQRFFGELSEAKSAVFYRNLGRFGGAFMALEQHYLSMPV